MVLQGLPLRPAEALSIWRRVGRPSARRGFLLGVLLFQGLVSVGWGVASVSTPT